AQISDSPAMKLPAFASLTLLAAFSHAGCAAESTSSTESSGADLTSALPHGLYGLASRIDGFRWINLLNLHGDGSFEGSMGNGVSDLSGHHFDANGTYDVKTIGGVPTLELRYDFFGPSVEHYVIGGTPAAPKLQFDDGSGKLDAAFALRPLPAPA